LSSLKKQNKNKDKVRRLIVQEQIDKLGALAYFDEYGSSEGDPRLWSGWVLTPRK
jgi:hypothetical protein